MPDADRPGPAFGRRFAAAVSLGLGILAALMMVGGHQPWDGREIIGLTATHGVHVGDALAIGPVLAGCWLARWCLER